MRTSRDKEGKVLLDLPRAPLPPADMPGPARLSPTWDATLLVRALRTQVLLEPFRPSSSTPSLRTRLDGPGRRRLGGNGTSNGPGRAMLVLEPFEQLLNRAPLIDSISATTGLYQRSPSEHPA